MITKQIFDLLQHVLKEDVTESMSFLLAQHFGPLKIMHNSN